MAAVLDPISPAAWDRAKARHLLNRAGFGVPAERVSYLAGLGPEGAVSHLLEYESIDAQFVAPDFLPPPVRAIDIRFETAMLSEAERRLYLMHIQDRERDAVKQLQAWWLRRMHTTPRPLEEKLALFWHGHFATSAQKVRSAYQTYQLNHVFRLHASGNFRELTINVGKSPSMLHYLDNKSSKKGNPNENWARELLELFTLGKGNYTEDDIKNAARAFTGWTCNHERFLYREEWHDDGLKTFLGRTGPMDGWGVINVIFDQPVAARFITAKLWRYFAGTEPSAEVLDGLAETLRGNGYALKPMLRRLFLSDAFYQPSVVGAQIKSPVQFVLMLADDLGMANPPYDLLARAAADMGQNLFLPPNVKGWDGNRAWINANSLLQRYNLPARLAAARAREAAASMGEEAKELVKEHVKERLRDWPGDERRAWMEAFREADPLGKRDMLESIGIEPPVPDAEGIAAVFAGLGFQTAGECIDALAQRLLARPLRDDQRATLLAALGADRAEAPLTPESIRGGARRAVLHLFLSMAEYQLC